MMAGDRPLLILDLDETLVHARTKPLPHAPDLSIAPYVLYRRPGLEGFLQQVAALPGTAGTGAGYRRVEKRRWRARCS